MSIEARKLPTITKLPKTIDRNKLIEAKRNRL